MNKISTVIMIIAILLVSTLAMAEPHPSKKKIANKTHVAQVDDIDVQLRKAEDAMESAYVSATFILADDTPEKANLIEAQRVWKIYRVLMSDVVKAQNADNAGYGDIIIKKHFLGVTKRRTEELKYVSSGPEDPPVDF